MIKNIIHQIQEINNNLLAYMLQAKCALPKQFPSGGGFFSSFYSYQSAMKHFLEMSLERGGLLETYFFLLIT